MGFQVSDEPACFPLAGYTFVFRGLNTWVNTLSNLRLGGHHRLGLRHSANDAPTQAAQGSHPEPLLLLRREVSRFSWRPGRQHARYLGCK